MMRNGLTVFEKNLIVANTGTTRYLVRVPHVFSHVRTQQKTHEPWSEHERRPEGQSVQF